MTTAQFAHETPAGEFVRQVNRFTDRITRDSDSGPGEGPDALGRWPVESGRYPLVWSRPCPWAHRARIVWGLLGLTEVISLATVDPIRDETQRRIVEALVAAGLAFAAEHPSAPRAARERVTA